MNLRSDIGDVYGAFRLDQFSLQHIANGLDLTWQSLGDFSFPYLSIRVQVHGMKIHQAWVDGKDTDVQQNRVEVSKQFSLLHLRRSTLDVKTLD